MSHQLRRPDHHAGTTGVAPQQPASSPKVPLAEAAAVCKVAKGTVRRWVARGLITGYRLPGSHLIRIDLAELEAAMTKIPAA